MGLSLARVFDLRREARAPAVRQLVRASSARLRQPTRTVSAPVRQPVRAVSAPVRQRVVPTARPFEGASLLLGRGKAAGVARMSVPRVQSAFTPGGQSFAYGRPVSDVTHRPANSPPGRDLLARQRGRPGGGRGLGLPERRGGERSTSGLAGLRGGQGRGRERGEGPPGLEEREARGRGGARRVAGDAAAEVAAGGQRALPRPESTGASREDKGFGATIVKMLTSTPVVIGGVGVGAWFGGKAILAALA